LNDLSKLSIAGAAIAMSDKPLFVWSSTDDSVDDRTFSILAAVEVAISIALYWAFAIWFQTQIHLWVSIIIAPVLLLRSDASVALGVKWFEQYIDKTFAFSFFKKRAKFRSGRFWIAMLVAMITTTTAAYTLGRLWLSSNDGIIPLLLSFGIGYCALQIGLAFDIAGSAAAMAAIAERKVDAAGAGAMLTTATTLGVYESGATPVNIIAAALATLILSFIGVLVGPSTLASAVAQVRTKPRGDTRGIAVMQAAMEHAPWAIAVFAPGFYFGGWFRSVGTRITATIRHLDLGIAAISENWWRTLFIVDLRYPPELIPGYKRSDFFTIPYYWSRIKQSDSLFERLVCVMACVILYAPAYVYRLSIKSTCWFYFPLVYIAGASQLSTKPALLADILWYDLREWGRRLLAVLTVAGVAVQSLSSDGLTKDHLPTVLISPLEYVFLIDILAVKPWQWFTLTSALVTLVIFGCIGRFRIIVDHAKDDEVLRQTASNYSWWLVRAMRVRNVSTALFFLIALIHALLWRSSAHTYLPAYILDLLHSFYGSALP
jgi:hypothetical protein